ncbi:Cox20p Ecym_4118 [Eremothecium cymbalariae DBVPG|uniref:Cytochrome c oxidase assembly protein COX20, mitochondrial n=1 Tax=Eremothecium cymbalariae (strain CBS 270.75 / DBVPG 7215 / KCTC 17166 / NRRL Y-17582) TaxID=931890 RepID=G8JT44_ERECY|nr:hypothetical protein Ecym_4118 [Eremothecium cymbalariae DBVPG\
MVWPFSSGTGVNMEDADADGHVSQADDKLLKERQPSNYVRGKKLLLEDTPPRFGTEISSGKYAKQQESSTLKEAWKTVTWNDFSFGKLASIPCFREAGMAGFSSMMVVWSVMFLYHKNPAKASNWSVGGLVLGSIVGWEHCRMQRRRSFMIAQMAKKTVAAKEAPMLHKPVNDARVREEWAKHGSSLEAGADKKPWYKFW